MPPLTPQNRLVRRRNVTASEVGALLGPHPYATPGTIFDRLTWREEPREPSEAMRIGSAMEPAILRYAAGQFGIRARSCSRTYEHRKVRLAATPDALGTLGFGQRVVIDVKMSARLDQWRTLPEHYEWQVRAQMACTGRDTALVLALVGMRLLAFEVYRDMDKEGRMIDAVRQFWTDHILTGIRPAEPEPVTEEIVYQETKR